MGRGRAGRLVVRVRGGLVVVRSTPLVITLCSVDKGREMESGKGEDGEEI